MFDFLNENCVFSDTTESTMQKMQEQNKKIGVCADKDGNFFLLKEGNLGVSIEQIDNSFFKGTETITEGFKLSLPKIPIKILTQIISFFRKVCQRSCEEVFARIYYDKEIGEYLPIVPTQRISQGRIEYNLNDERFQTENRYLLVLDIHSHNIMDACFSDTDDADERMPGKIYMVVGRLNQPIIQYNIRAFQTKHISLKFFDIFERPKVEVENQSGRVDINVPEEQIVNAILKHQEAYPIEWHSQLTSITPPKNFNIPKPLNVVPHQINMLGIMKNYLRFYYGSMGIFLSDKQLEEIIKQILGGSS